VFTLFSPTDIRRARDKSLANLETLILATTSHLFHLRNNPSFPNPDLASEREALNCIRVLTRILPFIYEADNLEAWENSFFWTVRKRVNPARTEIIFDEATPEEELNTSRTPEDDFKELRPLAEELLDTLIDLLFFSEFTLPKAPQTAKSKVTFAIWQSGVGCNTPIGTSKEFESNRCEILRLLLTLTSRAMYLPASTYCKRVTITRTNCV